MIAEAIKVIADLAILAKQQTKVYETHDCIAYIDGAGQTCHVPKRVPPIDYRTETLRDFVACMMDLIDDPGRCNVWVGDKGVVGVLDAGSYRVQRVTFPYKVTPWFARAQQLDLQVDQAGIIRLLNVHFRDHVQPRDLVNKLRRLRFDGGSAVTSTIKRGEESLGREIKSAVNSSDGEIPEEVLLLFPVFDVRVGDVDTTQSLSCVLEIEPARALFRLTVLPGELDNAKRYAMNEVRDAVVYAFEQYAEDHNGRATPPVYVGEP